MRMHAVQLKKWTRRERAAGSARRGALLTAGHALQKRSGRRTLEPHRHSAQKGPVPGHLGQQKALATVPGKQPGSASEEEKQKITCLKVCNQVGSYNIKSFKVKTMAAFAAFQLQAWFAWGLEPLPLQGWKKRGLVHWAATGKPFLPPGRCRTGICARQPGKKGKRKSVSPGRPAQAAQAAQCGPCAGGQ